MGRELCFVPHPLMSKLLTLLKPHQVKLFFLLSALLGYARWIFTGQPKWFIFGMLLSGLLLTALYEGKPGLLRQLKDAVRFKSSLPNYLSVILPLLLANLATLLIAYLLFGDLPSLPMLRTEPLLVVPLAFLILTGGPLAEELFGLRGFALPRLLDKYTPDYFEIVGTTESNDPDNAWRTRGYTSQECRAAYRGRFGKPGAYDLNASGVVDGVKVFKRILIRHRAQPPRRVKK